MTYVFLSTLNQPESWDDDDDGVWKPRMIPNPEYKGRWKRKKIKNPNYKGKWKIPWIDNPEFEDDPDLYVLKPLQYVGIEVWQVLYFLVKYACSVGMLLLGCVKRHSPLHEWHKCYVS
jgi:hypothetical protein